MLTGKAEIAKLQNELNEMREENAALRAYKEQMEKEWRNWWKYDGSAQPEEGA